MQTFLRYIVEQEVAQLRQHPIDRLQDYCYLFPTRRACKFFEDELGKRLGSRYFWAPHCFAVVDFYTYLYETQFDAVVLAGTQAIFELYHTYREHEPDADFDAFYAWGQLVLKDFDEVDRYMADTDALFSNLREVKDIDELFALAPEQLQFIKQFWRILDKENISDVENEFIRIWEVLSAVYRQFRQHLLAQNAAYEGMALRIVTEKLLAGELTLPFKRVVVGGFNALNKVEEHLITYLSDKEDSPEFRIYWDTDQYYMHPKSQQEAGYYLRQYYERWGQHPRHDWTCQTNMLAQRKEVRILGVPLKVGQAKYTGELLQKVADSQRFDMTDTAVVLGDESLLFPMLYSLPSNIDSVNVTMGYPLRQTPLYQLLESLVQLHKHAEQQTASDGSTRTIYSTVRLMQLVHNPFVKTMAPQAVARLLRSIERNNTLRMYPQSVVRRLTSVRIAADELSDQHTLADEALADENSDHLASGYVWVLADDLPADGITFFKQLLADVSDATRFETPATGLIQTFEQVLLYLLRQTVPPQWLAASKIKAEEGLSAPYPTPPDEADNDEPTPTTDEALPPPSDPTDELPAMPIEAEFMYQLLTQLRHINGLLRQYRQLVTLDTLWRLLREVMQTERLQFTGEPVRGLQIMGFLETRVLDFSNLFILSLNEGNIPIGKPLNTFIPHSLRRAFGLPGFTEQDYLYAYHFYRLLQRAQNIYLLYNTQVEVTGGGERSRFLLQLVYELQQYSQFNILQKVVVSPINTPPDEVQSSHIAKNEAIVAQLSQYLLPTADQQTAPLDEAAAAAPPPQRRLAATHLTDYIGCPMTFYWRYIAQLKEPEQLDEELNNRILGNVLHRTMELLYAPYKQKQITDSIIKKILNSPTLVNRALKKAFEEEHFTHHTQGNNLLLKRVLHRLVTKVLQHDTTLSPFSIIDLENNHDYHIPLALPNGKVVALKGIIDRIDLATDQNGNSYYRILDYKTGKIDIVAAPNLTDKDSDAHVFEKYLAKYFANTNYKAGWQVYFYAYLVWRQQQPRRPIQVGLYALKKMRNGITFLQNERLLDDTFFEVFEQQLQALLTELFDENTPFVICGNDKFYQYSPYRFLLPANNPSDDDEGE